MTSASLSIKIFYYINLVCTIGDLKQSIVAQLTKDESLINLIREIGIDFVLLVLRY